MANKAAATKLKMVANARVTALQKPMLQCCLTVSLSHCLTLLTSTGWDRLRQVVVAGAGTSHTCGPVLLAVVVVVVVGALDCSALL